MSRTGRNACATWHRHSCLCSGIFETTEKFLTKFLESQPALWEELRKQRGDALEAAVLECLDQNLESRGALDVLSRVFFRPKVPQEVKLSAVIEALNERFGTSFGPADQLWFDQLREEAVADAKLIQAAKANTIENSKLSSRIS